MPDLYRRLLGYGAGGTIAAALLWAGFVHDAEADLGTLLGAADVHLQLAAGMPARDRAGRPVPAREQLLAQAEAFLDRAACSYPDHTQGTEYRAYLHYLRGELAVAAAEYGAAAASAARSDHRDALVLNQVRMLHQAGDARGALAVIERHEHVCAKESRSALATEKAAVLALLQAPVGLAPARAAAPATTVPAAAAVPVPAPAPKPH